MAGVPIFNIGAPLRGPVFGVATSLLPEREAFRAR